MSFCAELRREHHDVWEANFAHPFVQGIGRGDLPREAFVAYLKQDYVYLIEACRFLGAAVARAPDLAVMGEFSKVLHGTLEVEMDLHRRTCAGVGISAEELEATEASPTCLGYTSWMMTVAETGTAIDAIAALLPCFWGYEEIGQRLMARGLPDAPEYRDWIETYASEEFAALTPWMREWIDARAPELPAGDRARIDHIFRTAGRWEYLFWEMAWRGETWPV